MNYLKVFDLFAGCGGFRVAFEKAGCEFVGFCEIDKYASKLYKAFFQTENEECYNDATKIDTAVLPDFDILTAGFPCQPFSIAGAKKGFNDKRGNLFFEIIRILRDKRPKYFLLENVKNLLSIDNRQTFVTIIKSLTDIGYTVQWAVLNSRYFGLPQNRERVFIFGSLRKECQGKIFPLERENQKTFTSIAEKEKFLWISDKQKPIIKKYSNTIVACYYKGLGGFQYKTAVLFGTLRTHKDGSGFREIKEDISPCIPARAREDGSGQPVVYTNDKITFNVRRLTPLECFRLQGFPDEIVKKAYELNISDCQLYKMAGNSVSVNVVYEIAKKIVEIDRKYKYG